MGFFEKIKNFWNEQVEGYAIVDHVEKLFRVASEKHPDEDQNEVLVAAWFKMMEFYGKPLGAAMARDRAKLFACLPSPSSARAMGLTVLFIVRPKIFQKYQGFSKEFFTLIADVEKLHSACDANSLNMLFAKYNPRTQERPFNKEEMLELRDKLKLLQ